MSASLPSDQWSVHSNASFYRNWPVDNVILSYFGGDIHDLDAHGETEFKKQMYQSMIGQLLFLKATIEGWRSTNVFGTLMASVH